MVEREIREREEEKGIGDGMTTTVYVVTHKEDNEPVVVYTQKEDAKRECRLKGKDYGFWELLLDPPDQQVWRVLIHFQETKVTYLVHIPTETQQRGYQLDKLYRANVHSLELHHLQLFTIALTASEAEEKAKQLLLEYIGGKDNVAG